PVQTIQGEQMLLVEIQIRTLAMNFWATIEHSLNYKYNKKIPEDVKKRLQRAAEAASKLDDEMSEIRGEIKEAQKVFMQKKENEQKKAEN
ncbi:GTP pyrophosphokinase family protein, partial [Planococcus sp. SIMBA_143]